MKVKDYEFKGWKERKLKWQRIVHKEKEDADAASAAAAIANKWRKRYVASEMATDPTKTDQTEKASPNNLSQ